MSGTEGDSAQSDDLQSTRFAWAALLEVMTLATGLASFALLVAILSAADYGVIGALIALSAMIGPFASFGSHTLLLKRASVSKVPAADFVRATRLTFLGTGGAALVAALVTASPAVFGLPLTTTAAFFGGHLVFALMSELAVALFVGLGALRNATLVRATISVGRLAPLVVLSLLPQPMLRDWALLTLVAFAATAGIVIALVTKLLGGWAGPGKLDLADIRHGIPFALGVSTEGVLASSDRPVLLQSGFEEAAGVYNAGYRVTMLSLLPSMAILKVYDQQLFARGHDGLGDAVAVSRKIMKRVAPTGLLASLFLVAVSGTTARVLPDSYEGVANVIRLLAALPFIKGVQFVLGNTLTAADMQKARLRLTGAAAVLNLLLNVVLIPRYGWVAAAATTLVTEVALTIGLAAAIRHELVQDRDRSGCT